MSYSHDPRDRHDPRREDMFRSPNPRQLMRSRHNRRLGGVVGGLSERYGWDVNLARIAAIGLAIFTGFVPVIVGYLVCWVVIPKAPRGRPALRPEEDQFWRNVSDRPRLTAGSIRYTFMELEERLQRLERRVTDEEWSLKRAFRDLER